MGLEEGTDQKKRDRAMIYTIFLSLVFVVGVIYLNASQLKPVRGQMRIGVTYMTMNNEFYQTLNAEIERVADEKGDLLLVRNPELDEEKQSQQIDYFRQQKVNVIVINPVKGDSPKIIASLKRAKQAGIKIIAVDSQLSHFTVDASVVSDNYQAGVLVAQRLMKQKNEAKILLLEHKGTVSAEQRIQGFLDTIQSEPAYQIVGREETRGQTELALPAVSQVIQDGLAFDAVVALNDRAAIGALAAIKENQLAMPISIYGIDGSPDMKVLLSTTDDIEGTVAQSPLKMGRQVMQVIECMRTGKSYKEQYKIPVEMIDKDNVDRYDVNGWQ